NSDIDALRGELARKLQEAEFREAGVGSIGRFVARNTTRLAQQFGFDDETATDIGAAAVGTGSVLTFDSFGVPIDNLDEASQRTKEQLRQVDDTGRLAPASDNQQSRGTTVNYYGPVYQGRDPIGDLSATEGVDVA
ncbi:MAG: hypothetical protein AAGL98_13855, partial [Planctomycetota bacterium]